MTRKRTQEGRYPISSIAELHGYPPHRIEYVIRTRGIAPVFRAGNCRLFDQASVDRIVEEINRIESRKEMR